MNNRDVIIVDTEFKRRSIRVYRRDYAEGTYYGDADHVYLYFCYDNGKLVQENKPAEAVMGWLANMMMNA